ncbi:unnamed protein product [Schistosoma spindalis]|nr:unnamed protein product [Schistosoma spindale]
MTSNLTTPDLVLLYKYVDETPTAINIAVPIISIVFFFASVVITYFIDDPGIKTLKNASPEPISEPDRNHLRYLAERKLYVDMKGHTFSAFTPSRTTTESDTHAGHSTSVDGGRRRACSESHAPSFPEMNSETQVCYEIEIYF